MHTERSLINTWGLRQGRQYSGGAHRHTKSHPQATFWGAAETYMVWRVVVRITGIQWPHGWHRAAVEAQREAVGRPLWPQEGASGSRGAVALQILNCNKKVSKDMWSPVHNIHVYSLNGVWPPCKQFAKKIKLDSLTPTFNKFQLDQKTWMEKKNYRNTRENI